MPCVSGAHAQQTLCTPGKQPHSLPRPSAVLHLQVAPSEQAHPPWMHRCMILQSIFGAETAYDLYCVTPWHSHCLHRTSSLTA